MSKNDILYIASPANPKVKELVKLRKRSNRDETGLFIIEGLRETTRALNANISIETLYTCSDFFTNEESETFLNKAEQKNIPRIQLSKEAFEKASNREGPDGIIAIARQWDTSLNSLELPHDALIIVAEGIEKPGNLGSMMRSAEASGADAFLICGHGTDIFNPNTIRNTQGACFTLKIAIDNDQAIETFLHQKGIRLIATSPDAIKAHWDANLTGSVAILMGTEHTGLNAFWLECADEQVAIPMAGSVDSLNVSTASAIVLFEAVRQRST